MIQSTLDWIEKVNKEFEIVPKRVIEIGSKDRNMKYGARNLFASSGYIGVDIESGSNVDFIVDAYHLEEEYHRSYFDAVLCLHLFEHLAKPWLVIDQINYILKDGGLLYVSMPTINFPLHNYPGDYWRITEQGMREGLMSDYDIISLEHAISTYGKHPFINCVGIKRNRE